MSVARVIAPAIGGSLAAFLVPDELVVPLSVCAALVLACLLCFMAFKSHD